MTRSLHRLIYCSQIETPPGELDEVVGAIIRASIRNNRAVDITGLLLVHAGYFVQALEGPMEAVLTTYARICNDPRHANTKVLSAGPATDRKFGDWNMCARHMTPSDDAILDTLSQRAAFSPERLTGAQALRLLTTVRQIQGRTQLRSLAS